MLLSDDLVPVMLVIRKVALDVGVDDSPRQEFKHINLAHRVWVSQGTYRKVCLGQQPERLPPSYSNTGLADRAYRATVTALISATQHVELQLLSKPSSLGQASSLIFKI